MTSMACATTATGRTLTGMRDGPKDWCACHEKRIAERRLLDIPHRPERRMRGERRGAVRTPIEMSQDRRSRLEDTRRGVEHDRRR
jgi:hypothetical protein